MNVCLRKNKYIDLRKTNNNGRDFTNLNSYKQVGNGCIEFRKRKLYNNLNYLIMPGRFTSKVNIVYKLLQSAKRIDY